MSPYERLTLEQIEARLRRDRRLSRSLHVPSTTGWLPLAVTLMLASSVLLAVVGMRTSAPSLLGGCAGLCPLTVLQAVRPLPRWTTPTDRITLGVRGRQRP
ncbi:DUF3040 domain-containing protein [Streptomyces sp. NPDC056105]|uniref:DUF3040 domain-containing protein n=1 Tax=Streptomyces sp. NPDC056105 TaxID=3345714 RepID=UPI0035DE2202